MIKTVKAGERSGRVAIPASKSWAHRLLIVAALSSQKSVIVCDGASEDIDATAECLKALGAGITADGKQLTVTPIDELPDYNYGVVLPCKESGSTLRFLTPVVGALGVSASFYMEGRLPFRPMDVLYDCLSEHGMKFEKVGSILNVSGHLEPGRYLVPGNISSQYISGLLMALPLLDGESTLEIIGNIESVDYIRMTEAALKMAGYDINSQGNIYEIKPVGRFGMPAECRVESDWSSASFFLAMGALSKNGITVKGMNPDSAQGDKEITNVLQSFGASVCWNDRDVTVKADSLKGINVDASQIPDLVPVIATVAALAEGKTYIYNAERLKLKESDRLKTTESMLKSLGADVTATDDGLVIYGKNMLSGGACESYNDHRIAMSAAVAALRCRQDVVIDGAECTAKSFASFWDRIELE